RSSQSRSPRRAPHGKQLWKFHSVTVSAVCAALPHPGPDLSASSTLPNVTTQVIVLNGGSSSGKSTIGRCLQRQLDSSWLMLGVDDLIEAMPQQGLEDGSLLRLGEQGHVEVGPAWRKIEASW